jgi:hypothetical protein
MSTNTMVTNLAPHRPCRETMLRLADNCMFEPIDLITYPAVDPATQVVPVKVAANDDPLTLNAINVVDDTAIKNVLFPAAPTEKDVFVLVNNNPSPLTLKVAAADATPVATLRGGSSVSFRYVAGAWQPY